jgi:hypothetical protein
MDFEKIFNELKEEVVSMAKDKFGNQGSEVVADMKTYLDKSKDKLEKWGVLLAKGEIDIDEFTWLVKSQKNLLVLKTLEAVGVNQIELGHFKNEILDKVLEKLTLNIL